MPCLTSRSKGRCNLLAGIIVGCVFTYYTFALRKWRYKTMTAIGFALAAAYLGYFYFLIDYGVEKEMLFIRCSSGEPRR